MLLPLPACPLFALIGLATADADVAAVEVEAVTVTVSVTGGLLASHVPVAEILLETWLLLPFWPFCPF